MMLVASRKRREEVGEIEAGGYNHGLQNIIKCDNFPAI